MKIKWNSLYRSDLFDETKQSRYSITIRLFVNEKSVYLPDRSEEMRCVERWKNNSREVRELELVKAIVHARLRVLWAYSFTWRGELTEPR